MRPGATIRHMLKATPGTSTSRLTGYSQFDGSKRARLLWRRAFITLLGVAAAWSLPAHAQQATMPRIGILSPGRSELYDPTFNMLNSFLRGLHELGYTEGQNLAIERLYADWSSDRLRELAAELVRRKPDIIVAFSTTAACPAKQ